jgi:hypothetical protein
MQWLGDQVKKCVQPHLRDLALLFSRVMLFPAQESFTFPKRGKDLDRFCRLTLESAFEVVETLYVTLAEIAVACSEKASSGWESSRIVWLRSAARIGANWTLEKSVNPFEKIIGKGESLERLRLCPSCKKIFWQKTKRSETCGDVVCQWQRGNSVRKKGDRKS